MITYKELIKTLPELFSNENAALKIITDFDKMEKWQLEHQKDENFFPSPKLGIFSIDRFNIFLRDLVEFKDGSLGTYDRILHPGFLEKKSDIVILPRYCDKYIVLHHFRHSTRSWYYEIPRGYAENKISIEENIAKELWEEIQGKIDKIVSLGEINPDTGTRVDAVKLYFVELNKVGEPNTLEGIDQIYNLSHFELEDWIRNGKIVDGYTLSAFLRAKLFGLL